MTNNNDEFCQKVSGWSIYFSPESEGFYAVHANGQQIGYCDSEPEILDEIDDEARSRNAANRGPFAYLEA